MKLRVKAGVRYWEDATVNGVEDTLGTLIPFRVLDDWCPEIDLETGRVLNWPDGMLADVHYKVCDAGEYWLINEAGDVYKYLDDYVPDDLLCHGAQGYGDYIILNIGRDGQIANYRRPLVFPEKWPNWKKQS